MMIKAFIFDVDGTLVDTRQLHISAWQRALKEFGLELSTSQIQSQLGRRTIDIAKTLLPENRKSDAARIAETKWRIFREFHSDVKPVPKTKELFNFLHKRGLDLALATSAIRGEAEFYVDILSLREFTSALVTAEDIQHSKPHPEIFLRAAAQLGVDPKESVVVGDSPHDMEAAKKAGMLAIGVMTGGFSEKDLQIAGANSIYRDIEDLFDHIEDIL
ncbi:MAG: HAD family phosphatase [Actinobacteria bacterium]|nr:HAD family phosphatase [Actinomycetota bacterium]